jgi:flavin-dependent dehydrogenase
MLSDQPTHGQRDRTTGLTASVDAAVLGGGPAGATAGRLLAAWGHAVAVCDRPARPELALVESIPPSSRKLFSHIGIEELLDRAAFPATRGNTSWWGTSAPRVEPFAAPSGRAGFQVPRAALDALLLQAARDAGAHVHGPALEVDAEDGSARIRTADGVVRARVVVDCTGRSGLLARRLGGARTLAPRTTALVGVWRAAAKFALPDWTHTIVESFDTGWVWSVPLDQRTRQLTAMIDAEAARRAGGLATAYRDAVSSASHVAKLFDGATLAARPFVRDASVSLAARASALSSPGFEAPWVLAGDAASFVDPVSSIGVKKAVASAWRAAVVVNTLLSDPGRGAMAFAFHDERERAVFGACLAEARAQFLEAATSHARPFWSRRVDAWGELVERLRRDTTTPVEPGDRALLGESLVHQAWERLRAGAGIDLRLAGDVTLERRPAIEGREVVWREVLASRSCPGGLGSFGRVSLPRLAEVAAGQREVPALYRAYVERAGEVSVPDFLGALSVLVGKGLLLNFAEC